VGPQAHQSAIDGGAGRRTQRGTDDVGTYWHSAGVTELRRLLARQHRVTSRAQALASGMTPDMLRHRIRAGGPWQRILPGVYLTLTGTPTTDQRDMAALLYAGPESIITAAAALRRHGLRAPATRAIDVLVPVASKRGSTGFVRIHRTARLPEMPYASGRHARMGAYGIVVLHFSARRIKSEPAAVMPPSALRSAMCARSRPGYGSCQRSGSREALGSSPG
jgi:hypothetical protein